MFKKDKPSKPEEKRVPEEHVCVVCGEMASFGIVEDWYCYGHWLALPETQERLCDELNTINGADNDDD